MTRKDLDQYPTPVRMLDCLLPSLYLMDNGRSGYLHSNHVILEPFAGDGVISNGLKELGYSVITNDADERYDCDYHVDMNGVDRLWPCDWIITNPPFSLLNEFLPLALQSAHVGVAMILRLTALEPTTENGNRGRTLAQYADNMRYLMTFGSPRPSYTADGRRDSVTTAWFVWIKGFSWSIHYDMKSPFLFFQGWR